MTLQDQIANLKVGDHVRVDGYSICVGVEPGPNPVWQIGNFIEWTPYAAQIKVAVVEKDHFQYHALGQHRFRKSSIIEVFPARPAKSGCDHVWCDVCCIRCGINVISVVVAPPIVCGNCKTQCHPGASDEVGAFCLKPQQFRRASGWTVNCGERVGGGPQLQPGAAALAYGWGVLQASGVAVYFSGTQVELIRKAPDCWMVKEAGDKFERQISIHTRNLDVVDRRKAQVKA